MACYNKPCHWSFDPTDSEIQVSSTDGNRLYHVEAEKARGQVSGVNQKTSSDDVYATNKNPLKPSLRYVWY